MSETPLASERDELLARVSAAQTGLAAQLAALMNVAADGNAATLSQELRAQLGGLSALREAISFASPADLIRMQMDIAATVAAAQTLAQSASSSLSSENGAPLSAADYQRKTAELDRRAAILMADDKAHDDDAHAIARRYGIDLSQQDKEREELERQRQAAHARGDKVAERQAELLLGQNTLTSMAAVAGGISDPEERKRFLQQMQAQQNDVEGLRTNLAAQLELDARRQAAQDGMSPEQTTALVDTAKTNGLAKADAIARTLAGADAADAAQLALEAAVKERRMADTKAAPALSRVEAILTPEAKAATQQAAAVIGAGYQAAAEASTFSLDMPTQIVLSTAPDAHTRIERPNTQPSSPSTDSQSRA